MGDPAGISPELTAKVITLTEVRAAADLIVIGDARVLAAGARVAGIEPDIEMRQGVQHCRVDARPVFIDLGNLDPARVELSMATRTGGEFALANFRAALQLAASHGVDAVCFTPFNKAAMRSADPGYDDEIGYATEVLGTTGTATEFNIPEGF